VNQFWACCDVDSDGSVMLVGTYGNRIYKSINTGANWSEVQPAGAVDKQWRCCSVNTDGSVMLAGVFGGRLYKSTDTGATWGEAQPAGATDLSWETCSISSNATVMIAGDYGGRLYYFTQTDAISLIQTTVGGQYVPVCVAPLTKIALQVMSAVSGQPTSYRVQASCLRCR
jgi:hypothetical protein